MSTTDDAESIIDSAVEHIDRQGGLLPFFRNVGIGGIAFALISQLIGLITGVGGVILQPLQAFGAGLADLVSSTIGVQVGIIDAGGQTAIYSLTEGLAQWLGVAAAPVAVGVAMVSIWVFMWFVDRIGFSPFAFITRLRR